MGATERRPSTGWSSEFGAEVGSSYDAQRTRLHAKAWLFRRDTGFDTAYVGSSNLSRAALLDGLEWNVRLSSVAHPGAARASSRRRSTRYWDDATFEPTTPSATATGSTTRCRGLGPRRPSTA